MSLNESIVEDAALAWFRLRGGYGGQVGELGYAVGRGPQLAPGEPGAERASFGEVVLVGRLREAIRRLNPAIPFRTLATLRDTLLPKLQFAFGGAKLVEARGFGMRTFGGAAVKHGLPVPKYAFDGLYLNLTIYRDAKAALGSLGEEVLNKLSKSERAGWEWLTTKGKATSGEYAAAMELDERTARRHLNQFLKLGLARKMGASTSTEYEIA